MALDIDRLAAEVVRGAELVVARAVAEAVTTIRAENAALRAESAALQARVAELETRAAVPGPQGEPGPPGPPGRDGVDGAPGKDGAPGRDGIDGKDGAPGRDGERGPEGPAGRDGKDGAPGRDGIDGTAGRDGIDGKDGRDGKDGFLPVVKAWADRVHYAGECVTRDGATWQAVRDTGRAPPHDDWICLAAAGRDGRSMLVRGTYDPAETYAALDVVAKDGGAFVARQDAPGECPGPGWQQIAQRGKAGMRGEDGKRGDRGEKGERGIPGPAVIAADVSGDGVLTLTNADGSTVTADFYDVLRRLA